LLRADELAGERERSAQRPADDPLPSAANLYTPADLEMERHPAGLKGIGKAQPGNILSYSNDAAPNRRHIIGIGILDFASRRLGLDIIDIAAHNEHVGFVDFHFPEDRLLEEIRISAHLRRFRSDERRFMLIDGRAEWGPIDRLSLQQILNPLSRGHLSAEYLKID
jgi:hypothetical protein